MRTPYRDTAGPPNSFMSNLGQMLKEEWSSDVSSSSPEKEAELQANAPSSILQWHEDFWHAKKTDVAVANLCGSKSLSGSHEREP